MKIATFNDNDQTDGRSGGIATSYLKLHDGLSDMIESGRLAESDIPEDYEWLRDSLIYLARHPNIDEL